MRSRQKVLLYLIHKLNLLGKSPTKTYLDKFLFILSKESNINDFVKFYNFYPYLYGPFSNEFALDLADLQSRAYVDEKLKVKLGGESIVSMLKKKEMELVDYFITKLENINVLEYVYKNYPAYTKNSRLEKRAIANNGPGIFSIGYEGHDIDGFLDALVQNDIKVLVDVRFNPFSMNLVFTKKRLEIYLKKVNIEYIHMQEFGIPGRYRQTLETEEDYNKLFSFYYEETLKTLTNKIYSLIELGSRKKIALMCFESDKSHCHRGVIAKEIEKLGHPVAHL